MKRIIIFAFIIMATNYLKAQWQVTPGPYIASDYIGMDVEKITVNGNNICAIIDENVYISNNNGTSWMYSSYGMENKGLCSVAYKDSIIYAGTFVLGIFKSTNHGSTYEAINNNLPVNSRIESILISGNIILIALKASSPTSISDVYYSSDNGATWFPTQGILDKSPVCLASNGTNIYAGTSYHGVYMSTDNGMNWTNIGLTNKSIKVIAAKDNRIFASENLSSGGFYLSTDNGANWTSVINGITSPYVGSIAIGDNYVYVTTGEDGVYRSDNNGSSWSYITNGLGNLSFIDIVAVNGANVYAGSNNFAVSTDEGTSWYAGLKTYNLNIKSIVASGPNIISATNNGIQKSFDNGLTWVRDLLDFNTLCANDSLVYAGGNDINISTDYGNTWNWQNIIGLPGSANFASIVTKDNMVFAGSFGKGIYYSNNYGYNWEQRINGLTTLYINSLTIVDTVIFAGSNNKGVYVSYDYGLNWNLANNGLPDTCIQTLASYNNNIYAGTKSNGIYKSTDNGSNWIQINNTVSDTNILCLYTCGVNVFAGVLGKGFLMSPDNGANWYSFNTGLMNYNIKTITENGTDIFIGTKGCKSSTNSCMNGGGVWKRALSELPLTLSFKEVKVSDRVICEGDSSNIKVSVIGGTSPYTYLWNNGNQNSSITVNPLTTTTYSLTVTDNNSDIITTNVTIIVNHRPSTPVIYQEGDTLFSNASDGNIWLINNYVIYNADTDFYIPVYEGNYSVVVILNGCISDTSNVIYVGINELNNKNRHILVYPNPVNNKIIIETSQIKKDAVLRIYDSFGNILIIKKIKECKSQIDISNFTSGIYFIKLINDKTVVVEKIIKY